MNNKTLVEMEGISTPFDQVAELYGKRPGGRAFDEDLCDYISNGYVFSTRDFFVMGRAVSRKGTVEQIRNPAFVFPEAECDTWFVHAFAGLKKSCLQFVPHPLKWIAWNEVNAPTLRFYNYSLMCKGREQGLSADRRKARALSQ